ncbi:phosphoesterase [Candidatus Uabimicrobium sp. HlEnr_7]|uniref:phosphoesterase n=1 Tax=Candidatus Uabimicrobium helgolandensis TaxID=3095367 RepID=UPI003557AFA8
MQKIWFTSDTHFGHGNIIKYCARPFFSANEQKIYEATQHPEASEEDKAEYKKMALSPESLDRHDEQLIANWNTCVSKGDRVYHLGDFSFGNEDYIEKILARLNGDIHLIKGNHDRNLRALEKRCIWVKDYFELKVKDNGQNQKIILLHYALRVWNASHYGSWHLYGHSHATLADDPLALSIDVGIDAVALWHANDENICKRYRPISFDEVKEILNKKGNLR